MITCHKSPRWQVTLMTLNLGQALKVSNPILCTRHGLYSCSQLKLRMPRSWTTCQQMTCHLLGWQVKEAKIGVMWHLLLDLVNSLAVVFWMNWRRSMEVLLAWIIISRSEWTINQPKFRNIPKVGKENRCVLQILCVNRGSWPEKKMGPKEGLEDW